MITEIKIGLLQKGSEIDPSTNKVIYNLVSSCKINLVKMQDEIIKINEMHGITEEEFIIDLSNQMYEDLIRNSNKEYDSVSVWIYNYNKQDKTFDLGNDVINIPTEDIEVIDNAIDIKTLDSISKTREDLNGFKEFIKMTLERLH